MKMYQDFKFDNSADVVEKFRKFIEKNDCPKIEVDLSAVNIFEAVKFMVLSSTYHYQKYPQGKLRCRIQSDDVKNFVSAFMTNNLELV